MAKGLVTLFGGSGFIGRYTARVLVRQGWRVRIACRRPSLAGSARLAGAPGWVDIAQVNVSNRASVERALAGADVAVNLAGILHERGRQSFERVHAEGACNVAEAAASLGLSRLVHVSAIGADSDSKARYARTKAAGEAATRAAIPEAVILRPAVVFGPEDGFLNRFASLATHSLVLPAIGGGRTQMQPVYAGDVATAIGAAIERADAAGKTYELGGPRIYAVRDIYDFVTRTIDRPRLKLPLPFLLAQPLGYLTGGLWHYVPPFSWGFLGEPPVTGNQVQMLRHDIVTSRELPGLAELGINAPESVEAIAPAYLWRYRPHGEFQVRRQS